MNILNKTILAGGLSLALMTSASWGNVEVSLGNSCSGGVVGCNFVYLANKPMAYSMRCDLTPINSTKKVNTTTQYGYQILNKPSSSSGIFKVESASFNDQIANLLVSYTPAASATGFDSGSAQTLSTQVLITGVDNSLIYKECTTTEEL